MSRRLGIIPTTVLTVLTVLAVVAPAADAEPRDRSAQQSVTLVAHRGASAYAPENTVAAFELAARQGADMFELDVQETKDHKLIVMHDTTLARTTDVEKVFPGRAPWKVRNFTLAEIRRLDAGSWFGPEYEGEPVPTLRDTLRAMSGTRVGMLLEVKAPRLYPGIEARIATELRRNPSWLRPGRLVVQSFDWGSMRRFHRKMPHVPIGLLGTPATSRMPKLAAYADQINPQYRSLTPQYVRRVHGSGMDVFTWTADDPATTRRLISYGVDGVLTNKPHLIRDVIDAAPRRAT